MKKLLLAALLVTAMAGSAWAEDGEEEKMVIAPETIGIILNGASQYAPVVLPVKWLGCIKYSTWVDGCVQGCTQRKINGKLKMCNELVKSTEGENIEIGLRSDGVVVWRERPEPYKPEESGLDRYK